MNLEEGNYIIQSSRGRYYMRIGTDKRIELGTEPVFSDERAYDKAYTFNIEGQFIQSLATEKYVAPYTGQDENIYLKANEPDHHQEWEIIDTGNHVDFFLINSSNQQLIVANNQQIVMEGEQPGVPINWDEVVVQSLHEEQDPNKSKQKWVFKKVPANALVLDASEIGNKK